MSSQRHVSRRRFRPYHHPRSRVPYVGAYARRRRHHNSHAPPLLLQASKPSSQSVVAPARSHSNTRDFLVRRAPTMLQASSEPAGSLWVPGTSPQLLAPDGSTTSARAREIARRRDEMLGMLRGLPESEYELSLTDLVEKTTNTGTAAVATQPIPTSPLGRPAEQQQQQPASASKRGSARRRGDGGSGRSSFRSSSDGVLLNFYMPRVISRSFTAPRPGAHHHAPPAARAADDCNKRERDSDAVKCWPMPWDRRWRKSSRRDQAGESASILNNAAAAPEESV